MKQDIRDLFKGESDLKSLSKNHRTEFLDKLQKQPKKNAASFSWLKIAAALLVALTVGFSVFYNKPIEVEIPPMIAQIEAVEAEYLKNIEKEWVSFLALAKDEKLVKRYREKLDGLDKDYQDISEKFKVNTNNILTIEALVENLKTRLQLLKDIQEHIKLLNQENENYEAQKV